MNPPAAATAPISGMPVRRVPSISSSMATTKAGTREARIPRPTPPAFPAPDDAAEERPEEREPEEQEGDHQHPERGGDDAAASVRAHDRSFGPTGGFLLRR